MSKAFSVLLLAVGLEIILPRHSLQAFRLIQPRQDGGGGKVNRFSNRMKFVQTGHGATSRNGFRFRCEQLFFLRIHIEAFVIAVANGLVKAQPHDQRAH